MHFRTAIIAASFLILGGFTSCATLSGSGAAASAPMASGTPLASSYTRQEAVVTVALLDEATVKSKWGYKWPRNPFLPYLPMFFAKPFEVFPIGIQSNSNVAVVIGQPRAMSEGNPVAGRAYDKSGYIDFWLTVTTDEDAIDWEKKKRDIERTVPYLDSEMALYARTMYVVPFVVSTKSPMPDTIILELLVNGTLEEHVIDLKAIASDQ